MESSLVERLSINADKELKQMIAIFNSDKAPIFYAGMENLFRIAKVKPPNFVNHAPVLAISIGGTNIKLMLASMENGCLVVHYIRSIGLPSKRMSLKEFFDEILMADRFVLNYLRKIDGPAIGVFFPSAVIGDVPYHATKVPLLDGIIARNYERDMSTHNFRTNFENYLKTYGIKPAALFLQGDGIVAHHGAISLSNVETEDKTVLVICGTGMALGDEENYLQVGIMPLLEGDEELFPKKSTENCQLQYAIAGKGIFSIMERAIRLKSREPLSKLSGFDLSCFFTLSSDSKLVADIWRTTLGEKMTSQAENLRKIVGEEGFIELQEISTAIMMRTVQSIANSIVATIVKMGPDEKCKGHKVYFEGSICVDSSVLPEVKKRVREIISNRRFFEEVGVPVPVPYQPEMEVLLRPLKAAEKSVELRWVDITLIGAASMIIAQTCE